MRQTECFLVIEDRSIARVVALIPEEPERLPGPYEPVSARRGQYGGRDAGWSCRDDAGTGLSPHSEAKSGSASTAKRWSACPRAGGRPRPDRAPPDSYREGLLPVWADFQRLPCGFHSYVLVLEAVVPGAHSTASPYSGSLSSGMGSFGPLTFLHQHLLIFFGFSAVAAIDSL